MKNNDGFTLVEILAVIAIIGVLGLVAIPKIGAILNSSKDDLYNEQIKLILSAAEDYGAENVFDLPTELGNTAYITVGELKRGKYLKTELRNPKNNKCFNEEVTVIIKNMGNKFDYSIDEDTLGFYDADVCHYS